MDCNKVSDFVYPLSDKPAKFEYKLVNQNGKLAEVPLHKEYQRLSLFEEKQPFCQQEVTAECLESTDRTVAAEHTHENSRKRNAGDDDSAERDSMISCEDITSSDTDSNTQVSASSRVHSYRTNGLLHPPTKKRLTSGYDSIGSASFQVESPGSMSTAIVPGVNSNMSTVDVSDNGRDMMANMQSQVSTSHSLGEGINDNNNNNNNINSNQTGNLVRDQLRRPKTPNTMNSPSQTPVSDMEEDPIQQLPLPSPSASPIQSDHENDDDVSSETPRRMGQRLNLEMIESHMASIPSTQAELINTIKHLSQFLSPQNQNHLIFRLLQKTNRSSLSTFNGLLHDSLKRDLLGNLPIEIAMKVLSYLDADTLLSISEVCKKWFKIINNTALWANLLKRDKLITDENVIKYELSDTTELLSEWCTLPDDINPAQVLYKKRRMIVNRWLDPKFKPKRISVKGHGNKVVTCLQHDEEKIVTGVDDKYILIYSTQTGQLTKVLEGHDGGVWAMKYYKNTLVTGSTDRSVRIWNMATGKCTHVFRGHTSTIRCLDIITPSVIGKDAHGEDIVFPEHPLLITGSRDHNIHVWRLPILQEDAVDEVTFDSGESENPYLIAVLTGHTQSVRSLSGYGNIIISGSYDSTVRIWDLLDNGRCKHILQGHQDRVYSTAIDFDRKVCFSGSMDSTINIWNFETGELLKVLEGHSSLVGLLALVDGVLVSAAADASLRIWDPATGDLRSKLRGHAAAITCFEHDGLKVVSGSEKMLKLWDAQRGEFARNLLDDVTGGIWQVRIDYKRCVAAVQRVNSADEGETYIEILDFSEVPNFQS
ncbi:CDC4 [Candida theae]|uniref:CDC4 n=1 Tax=Candida theae TaxID=1198502 RepID=A0AAD5BHL2_9ASCO|nr:CDC4 [Candida theae]KAI5963905.1 CDC4 [Candida theae]